MRSWTYEVIIFLSSVSIRSSCLWPCWTTDPRYVGRLQGTEWRHWDGWRSPSLNDPAPTVSVFVFFITSPRALRFLIKYSEMNSLRSHFPDNNCPSVCVFVCCHEKSSSVALCVWLCRPGMLTCPPSWQSNQIWKDQIVFPGRFAFLGQTV